MDDNTYSRERHLKGALARLQRRYHEEAQPIIEALAKIEAAKRPGPITLPDGRVFQYVGPWPNNT